MRFHALVVPLLALSLSGCIYLDRSEHYQRASSIKPLELPEGVTAEPAEPLYPIPEVSHQTDSFYDVDADGFVVPRPEPMSAERETAKVRMQKVDDRRWILLEAPASQVWPLTQSFLSRTGLSVAKSVPATGLIETDWVEFTVDSDIKNRFQLRIEQGVRPETTEVHVLHYASRQPDKASIDWPADSTNPEREAWLLDELANSLALSVDNRAASLLGQSVGGEVKAELFVDGEEPALRLRLDAGRAMASLNHAFSQEEFKLWQQAGESGVFYFQYIDEEDQPGRLRRWLQLGEEVPQQAPYSLDKVLNHLADKPAARDVFASIPGAAFSAPLESTAGYLLVLKPDGDTFVAKVRDSRGMPLERALNRKVLSAIKRNLI